MRTFSNEQVDARSQEIIANILEGNFDYDEGIRALLELLQRSTVPARVIAGLTVVPRHFRSEVEARTRETLLRKISDRNFFQPARQSGASFSGWIHQTSRIIAHREAKALWRMEGRYLPVDPQSNGDSEHRSLSLEDLSALDRAAAQSPFTTTASPRYSPLDELAQDALENYLAYVNNKRGVGREFANAGALIFGLDLSFPARPLVRSARQRLAKELERDIGLAQRCVKFVAAVKGREEPDFTECFDVDFIDIWEPFSVAELKRILGTGTPLAARQIALSAVQDFPRPDQRSINRFLGQSAKLDIAATGEDARRIAMEFIDHEYSLRSTHSTRPQSPESERQSERNAKAYELALTKRFETHSMLQQLAGEIFPSPHGLPQALGDQCRTVLAPNGIPQ